MDLNDDGSSDILSGSYSRSGQPMAGLFQVLWRQADGTFKQAEVLIGSDGEPLIIPPGEDTAQNSGVSLENICTRPTAIDWDADGDLDLVVGNFGGSFYVFSGAGEGKFDPVPQPLLSDGEPLKIDGHHSDPFIVDWDGDGDLDLLSGSSQGGVQWAENQAGAGKTPEMAEFTTLIEPAPQVEPGQLLQESDLVGPTSSTRVWADDVNGDGKLDLLVGDRITLTSPATGLSEEEYQEKYDAWKEKMDEATLLLQQSREQESSEEDDDQQEENQNFLNSWLGQLFGATEETSEAEQAQEQYMEISQQRSEFMEYESTGFVWLYLRK